jgi:hypothetical protein
MNYEEMMKLIGQGGESAGLDQQIQSQLAQAKQMREGMPELQMRGTGRVQVAPHWSEGVAQMVRGYGSGQMTAKAGELQGQQRGVQQQQYAAILKAIMAQQQPQAPTAPIAGSGSITPGMQSNQGLQTGPRNPFRLGGDY